MSADTPRLSTEHNKLGKPGGPGLFHDKSLQLPAYIQNIAHALMRDGRTKSQAIQLAIGVCKNWASGQGNVKPEVRAAATKAIAEWEALKAKAKATPNKHDMSNSKENFPEAIELAHAPYRYRHGWIKLEAGGEEKKLDELSKPEVKKAWNHHSLAALKVDQSTEEGRAEAEAHMKAASAARDVLEPNRVKKREAEAKKAAAKKVAAKKVAAKKTATGQGKSALPKGADLRRNSFRAQQNNFSNEMAFANFNEDQREKLAKVKEALPDGSFPIRNASDLKNAIQAHGRAKNPAVAKAWIIKRAKSLNLTNLLPAGWAATDLSNPVDLASSTSSGSGGQQDSGNTKKPGYKAQSQYLPPGAVGYTHGWQPVDASGNKVGKPLTQEQRDAAGHDKGTQDAIHKAYENKAKADGTKAQAQAKRDAAKKAAADKKAASDKAKLDSAVVKQAQADRKAGRKLTPFQEKALSDYEAQQKDKAESLRGGKTASDVASSATVNGPDGKPLNAHWAAIVKESNLDPKRDLEVYHGPSKKFEDGTTRKDGDIVLSPSGVTKVAAVTKAKADAKKKAATTNLANEVDLAASPVMDGGQTTTPVVGSTDGMRGVSLLKKKLDAAKVEKGKRKKDKKKGKKAKKLVDTSY